MRRRSRSPCTVLRWPSRKAVLLNPGKKQKKMSNCGFLVLIVLVKLSFMRNQWENGLGKGFLCGFGCFFFCCCCLTTMSVSLRINQAICNVHNLFLKQNMFRAQDQKSVAKTSMVGLVLFVCFIFFFSQFRVSNLWFRQRALSFLVRKISSYQDFLLQGHLRSPLTRIQRT